MSLAQRLTNAMAIKGISQAELARACNVKPPSVHGWLSGKAKFLHGENLLLAAAALGVSQQWLATGEGAMQAAAGSAPAAIDLDNNPDYPAMRRVRFRLSTDWK